MMRVRMLEKLLGVVLGLSLLTICGEAEPPGKAAEPALAKELVFYDWADDMPQSVLVTSVVRHFVIPAANPRKRTAELFIDFLLRPEIGARIANELYYATPNEAAFPFIKPEILNDPVIFPPIQDIRRAEVIMPLSPAGQGLHEQIWRRYRAGRTHAGPSRR